MTERTKGNEEDEHMMKQRRQLHTYLASALLEHDDLYLDLAHYSDDQVGAIVSRWCDVEVVCGDGDGVVMVYWCDGGMVMV